MQPQLTNLATLIIKLFPPALQNSFPPTISTTYLNIAIIGDSVLDQEIISLLVELKEQSRHKAGLVNNHHLGRCYDLLVLHLPGLRLPADVIAEREKTPADVIEHIIGTVSEQLRDQHFKQTLNHDEYDLHCKFLEDLIYFIYSCGYHFAVQGQSSNPQDIPPQPPSRSSYACIFRHSIAIPPPRATSFAQLKPSHITPQCFEWPIGDNNKQLNQYVLLIDQQSGLQIGRNTCDYHQWILESLQRRHPPNYFIMSPLLNTTTITILSATTIIVTLVHELD